MRPSNQMPYYSLVNLKGCVRDPETGAKEPLPAQLIDS